MTASPADDEPPRIELGGERVDWPDDWDKQRRIESIADTISHPRSAGWVADQAGVTAKTARKYLDQLVESGSFTTTTDGETGATLYYPDPEALVVEKLRQLVSQDKDDLVRKLDRIATQIEGWQDEFDVGGPDELRKSVDESLSPEERRRRQQLAYEWDRNVELRDLLRAALDIHDPVTDYVRAHRPEDASEIPPEELGSV